MNSDISFSQLGKQWYRQQKKIKGTVQVQHNRLLEEITTAYDTAYVCVDRSERFMPVRDLEDLNTVKMLVNSWYIPKSFQELYRTAAPDFWDRASRDLLHKENM